jgi:RNA polymerase sigma factor (sigma-70 family)
MATDPFNFVTTRWSLVLSASEGSELAMSKLAESYRIPLHSYITALGYTQEADDLVQEFFASKFLKEGFLHNTQQGDRRFRTFLKACVRHFIIDTKDPCRRRRVPGDRPGDLSLEMETDEGAFTQQFAAREVAADLAWDRAWARELLQRAREKLSTECERARKIELLHQFYRVLDEEPDAPSRREVAQACQMTEGAVGVAFYRMRERLKALLADEIRETVTNPNDWMEEQRHLLSVFSAPYHPNDLRDPLR